MDPTTKCHIMFVFGGPVNDRTITPVRVFLNYDNVIKFFQEVSEKKLLPDGVSICTMPSSLQDLTQEEANVLYTTIED